MSIVYTGSTVIGYRVIPHKDAIKTSRIVPTCPHDPPAGTQFCPTCGSRVGHRTHYTRTEAWDDFIETVLNPGRFSNDFILIVDFESPDSIFWIGYGSNCHASISKKIETRLDDSIKATIRTYVKPWVERGLFDLDESEFGVWTLMIGR